MWTELMDMHSGGNLKEEPYHYIFIEAPKEEAEIIFYNRFGHNPNRVSCTCCGEDYSIDEYHTLKRATGFKRGCRSLETPRDPKTGLFMNSLKNTDEYFRDHYYLENGEDPKPPYKIDDSLKWNKDYITLEEYLKREDVLIIRADDIKPDERTGDIPEQGYIWHD